MAARLTDRTTPDNEPARRLGARRLALARARNIRHAAKEAMGLPDIERWLTDQALIAHMRA